MFEVIDDHPEFFLAHNGKGEFKIAKKALSEAKRREFQGLCKGGRVQKMAGGGEVQPPPELAWSPPSFDLPPVALPQQAPQFDPSNPGGFDLQAAIAAQQQPQAPAPPPPQGGFPPIDMSQNIPTTGATPWAPGTPGLPPPVPAPEYRGGSGMPAEAPQAAPRPPPGLGLWQQGQGQPVPQPQQGGGGGDFGFNRYSRQMEAGIAGQAKVAHAAGVAQAAQAQGAIDYNEAKRVEVAEAYKNVQTEQDSLRHDILNSKIDPNRLWASRSDGQKAMTMVGLFLGGIGSGINGGPNESLEVFNKMIDRDINAQMANLDTKKGSLAFLQQKWGNITAAATEDRLYKMTAIEEQGRKIAAQQGADMAQYDAMIKQSQWGMQKAQLGMSLAMFAMQKRAIEASQQGGGGQGPGGAPATIPEFEGPMGALAKAQNTDRGLTVAGPNGQPIRASSEQAANALRARSTGVNAAKQLLAQLGSTSKLDPNYDTYRHLLATELARAVSPSGEVSEKMVDKFYGDLPGLISFKQGARSLTPIHEFLSGIERSMYAGYAQVPQVQSQRLR